MNKEFETIQIELQSLQNFEILIQNIAIYSRTSNPLDDYYILLSNNDLIDRIIIKNGGVESIPVNPFNMRFIDNIHNRTLLLGNKKLVDCLMR